MNKQQLLQATMIFALCCGMECIAQAQQTTSWFARAQERIASATEWTKNKIGFAAGGTSLLIFSTEATRLGVAGGIGCAACALTAPLLTNGQNKLFGASLAVATYCAEVATGFGNNTYIEVLRLAAGLGLGAYCLTQTPSIQQQFTAAKQWLYDNRHLLLLTLGATTAGGYLAWKYLRPAATPNTPTTGAITINATLVDGTPWQLQLHTDGTITTDNAIATQMIEQALANNDQEATVLLRSNNSLRLLLIKKRDERDGRDSIRVTLAHPPIADTGRQVPKICTTRQANGNKINLRAYIGPKAVTHPDNAQILAAIEKVSRTGQFRVRQQQAGRILLAASSPHTRALTPVS